MNESYCESVIFVKPRINKESRDIIQRLHDIGKTEFYNYCHINKAIAPFYSVILLADIVPLNKLFGKDYVFCIDKRKEHVVIIPAFVIPPSFKIKTYKEFMEMDTFELFDLPIDKHKRFEKITNRYIKVDTKEQLISILALCCEHSVVTLVNSPNNNGTSEYIPSLLRDYIIFNFSFDKTWYLYIWYDFLLLRAYENVPENEDVLSAETLMKIYKEEVK